MESFATKLVLVSFDDFALLTIIFIAYVLLELLGVLYFLTWYSILSFDGMLLQGR